MTVEISIHTQDPIMEAGVLAQLRPRPEVRIAAPNTEGRSIPVVVAESLDEVTLRLLRKLRHQDPPRTVLVVSQLREEELVLAAEAGVIAVLQRCHSTADRLISVILSASRGEGTVPGDLLADFLAHTGHLYRQQNRLLVSEISEREKQILKLAAEGYSTREIADCVSYSERTVKTVLNGLVIRLALRNRTHAVAYAIREGLI